MDIKPLSFVSSYKTGEITGLTRDQITAKLGFGPTSENDDKSAYTWDFSVDDAECAIWDWKGSYRMRAWSAYGPADKLRAVFGNNYRPYRL